MSAAVEYVPKRGAAKDRRFIGDEALRNTTILGLDGFEVKVRLTSYRSLPLSCIKSVSLSVDGEQCDPAALLLTVNYATYRLRELPQLSSVWWFILDYARLFSPRQLPLTPGLHEISGTLITVEPYMTAGRFAFHNSATKTLRLDDAEAGRR